MDWSLVAFALANSAHLHYKRAAEYNRDGPSDSLNFDMVQNHLIVGDVLKALSEAFNFGAGNDEVNNECTAQHR